MINKNMLGLWSLVSMEQRYEDGRLVYPFGQDATGRLFYGADSSMFVVIQKSGRTPFTTGKQWTASDAEKAKAYGDYLTYSGRFEATETQVTHHIEFSLFPDWIGAKQVRELQFDGDNVVHLVAHLERGTSEARSAYLTWKREH